MSEHKWEPVKNGIFRCPVCCLYTPVPGLDERLCIKYEGSRFPSGINVYREKEKGRYRQVFYPQVFIPDDKPAKLMYDDKLTPEAIHIITVNKYIRVLSTGEVEEKELTNSLAGILSQEIQDGWLIPISTEIKPSAIQEEIDKCFDYWDKLLKGEDGE